MEKARQFSDLDLDFLPHPRTQDIVREFDEEAVKRSVVNLIKTRMYERPFHPELGCQIFSLLFDNFNSITRQICERTVKDVIDKFEPRARIETVTVKESVDQHALEITIIFRLVNSNAPIILTTLMSRVR